MPVHVLNGCVLEYTSVGVHNQSPGEIKRREVELDPQVSPEEIKRREVVLGLRVGPL